MRSRGGFECGQIGVLFRVALFLLAFHAIDIGIWGEHGAGPLISGIIQLAMGLVVTFASFQAARRSGSFGRAFWRLAGTGIALWCFGQILATYIGNIRHQPSLSFPVINVFLYSWPAPLLMCLFLDRQRKWSAWTRSVSSTSHRWCSRSYCSTFTFLTFRLMEPISAHGILPPLRMDSSRRVSWCAASSRMCEKSEISSCSSAFSRLIALLTDTVLLSHFAGCETWNMVRPHLECNLDHSTVRGGQLEGSNRYRRPRKRRSGGNDNCRLRRSCHCLCRCLFC